MPRRNCICKLHVPKWAASQRYQLQHKLKMILKGRSTEPHTKAVKHYKKEGENGIIEE